MGTIAARGKLATILGQVGPELIREDAKGAEFQVAGQRAKGLGRRQSSGANTSHS